jgi:alpha-ribazole phosphatase
MTLWVWRHPQARGAAGRCIGRTDLTVDPRRAKRLAHRIRQTAREQGLPKTVLTSPLQRCRAVGRHLRRWGWQHRVDPALAEMDFGGWDGCAWADIAQADVDAWCENFLHHAPGDGESLHTFFTRIQAWRAPGTDVCIVGHAGWMLARQWLVQGQPWPTQASQWPAAPAHGTLWTLGSLSLGGC